MKNKNTSYPSLAQANSILIYLLILSIKYDALVNNFLILDDIQYFTRSFITKLDLSNQSLYFKFYHICNTYLSSPSNIRIFYFFIYGILLFTIIYIINSTLPKDFDRKISLILLSIGFLHPLNSTIIHFFNGSYNVISFLLFSISIIFLRNHLKYSSALTLWLIPFAIVLLLSSKFTSNGIFLPLSFLVYPWWWDTKKVNIHDHLKNALIPIIISLVIPVNAFLGFKHGYSNIPGRINYNLEYMLEKFANLNVNIFYYLFNSPHTTGMSFTQIHSPEKTTIFYLVLSLLIIAILIISFKVDKSFSRFIWVPFFASIWFLSTVPLTIISVYHLWHYFIPILSICMLSAILIKSFFHSKNNNIVNSILFLVLIFSYLTALRDSRLYTKISYFQESLVNQIQHISIDCEDNDVILIYIPRSCQYPNVGISNIYRSKSFLEYYSKKKIYDGKIAYSSYPEMTAIEKKYPDYKIKRYHFKYTCW